MTNSASLAASEINHLGSFRSQGTTEIDEVRQYQISHVRPLRALGPMYILYIAIILALALGGGRHFLSEPQVIEILQHRFFQDVSLIGLTLLVPLFIHFLLDSFQAACFHFLGYEGMICEDMEKNGTKFRQYVIDLSLKFIGILLLAMPLTVNLGAERWCTYILPLFIARDLYILFGFEYVLLSLDNAKHRIDYSRGLLTLTSVGLALEVVPNTTCRVVGAILTGTAFCMLIYRSCVVFYDISQHKVQKKGVLGKKNFLMLAGSLLHVITHTLKFVGVLYVCFSKSMQYPDRKDKIVFLVLFQISGVVAILVYGILEQRVRYMDYRRVAKILSTFESKVAPCVVSIHTELKALLAPQFINSSFLQPQSRGKLINITTAANIAYDSLKDINSKFREISLENSGIVRLIENVGGSEILTVDRFTDAPVSYTSRQANGFGSRADNFSNKINTPPRENEQMCMVALDESDRDNIDIESSDDNGTNNRWPFSSNHDIEQRGRILLDPLHMERPGFVHDESRNASFFSRNNKISDASYLSEEMNDVNFPTVDEDHGQTNTGSNSGGGSDDGDGGIEKRTLIRDVRAPQRIEPLSEIL